MFLDVPREQHAVFMSILNVLGQSVRIFLVLGHVPPVRCVGFPMRPPSGASAGLE